MECGICLRQYEPKLNDLHPCHLECGHTFCRQCIFDLIKSTPECPLDHIKIYKSLADIKINFALLDVITNHQGLQISEVKKTAPLLKTKSALMEVHKFKKNLNFLDKSKENEEMKKQEEQFKNEEVNEEVIKMPKETEFHHEDELKPISEFPKMIPLVLAAYTKFGEFSVQASADEESSKTLGPFELSDGSVYQGQMLNGLREGRGKQQWADGSFYDGYWKNNYADGFGRLIHSDGEMYEGEWKNDKAQGNGTFYHVNGTKYTGEWLDDKQHGKGLEIWPDGARYEGLYSHGKKNGYGEYLWADGSTYNGNFVHNNIDGHGKYTWPDLRLYVGDWKINEMHGKGVFIWNDGRKYEGEYVHDKKHGYGVFTWSDGRYYKGTWVEGKQHGIGTYCTGGLESKEKKGEWIDGKRIEWIIENEAKSEAQTMN